MWNSLTFAALVFAAASVALLLAAVAALRRRRILGAVTGVAGGVGLLALAGLFGTLTFAVQGYQAFTREDLAARVTTRPVGPQRFIATFHFPDGRRAIYTLAGDQLYVDAQILKWKPAANLLGLHTAYKLDRVAGRYTRVGQERASERTVYRLSEQHRLDAFDLRERYSMLAPLLDTEYGSATYVRADEPGAFEVRVSTTGLLIRPAAADTANGV